MPLPFLKPIQAPAPVDYELIRSARRRSLSIEISKARVLVRAPFFVATADIDRFVRDKSDWVKQKLTQQQAQLSAAPNYTFTDGSQLPFLGEPLTLVVRKQSQADVVRYGDKLLVVLSSRGRRSDEAQAQRLVFEWYQTQALTMLQAKTNAAAQQLGVRYAAMQLKATRSKWGHCTSAGVIQYNWQILLAPEAIVDYLVAHEVSHLLHHNHSPAFWSVVASLCPDYKKRRAWLKSNSLRLMF